MRVHSALARVVPVAAKSAERTGSLLAAQIVGDMSKSSLRERMAVRLVNPNPHSSRSQIYADIGLIDGLLMPKGGFGAFVQRNLLPPSRSWTSGLATERGDAPDCPGPRRGCAGQVWADYDASASPLQKAALTLTWAMVGTCFSARHRPKDPFQGSA